MSQNYKHDLVQVLDLILGRQTCLLNCTPEVAQEVLGRGGSGGRGVVGGVAGSVINEPLVKIASSFTHREINFKALE